MSKLYLENFGWVSGEDCSEIDIEQFSDIISSTYVVSPNGASINKSNPFEASLGISYKKINCGVSALIYLNTISDETINNYITSDYKIDSGRIQLSEEVPQKIEVLNIDSVNASASGTYTITSEFKNSKPVYLNINGWRMEYNPTDGSWFISHPSNSFIIFENCSIYPNSTYSLSGNNKIKARWDAQYLRNDGILEELYGDYNFEVNSGFISDDTTTEQSRGMVFDFSRTNSYKNFGRILNDTFASNNFTISVWINPKSKYALGNDSCCYRSDANEDCLLNCRKSAILSKTSSYQVLENDSFVIWSDGTMSTTSKTIQLMDGAQVSINKGRWNHLVYSVNDGKTKIYLNGDDVTEPQHKNIQNDFSSELDSFVVGNINLQDNIGDSHYWGLMDDIRVYDTPLNWSDIQELYKGDDSVSQLPSFEIPPTEPVETVIPMSPEIESVDQNILTDGVKKIEDSFIFLQSNENGDLLLEHYKVENKSFVKTEIADILIGNYPELVNNITEFDFIPSTENTSEKLLIWSHLNYFYVFEKSESDEVWKSQKISQEYIHGRSKFYYSTIIERNSTNSNDPHDILFILTKDDLKLYRKNFANLWSIFKVFDNVDTFTMSGNLLFILQNDSSTFDNFDILTYEVEETFNLLNIDTYYGSFNTSSLSFSKLSIGSKEYLFSGFTDAYSSEFKFDPNDSYLKKASPSELVVYEINKNQNGLFTEIIDTMLPSYRNSGINYSGIANFGTDVYVGGQYLVVTSSNVNYVYLYKIDNETKTFSFVTNLNLGDNTPSPVCIVTNEYCLVLYGKYNSDGTPGQLNKLKLFYFNDENLTIIQDSLPPVTDSVKVWWDFGTQYGKLDSNSHIVFDKSGNFNHLGATIGFNDISVYESGALDDQPIYDISKLTELNLKSPVSTDLFSEDFSIFIWYKDVSNSKIPIFKLSDESNPTASTNEFIIYSNCDVKYGDVILNSRTIKSTEWRSLCVKKHDNVLSVYLNTTLVSISNDVDGKFVKNILNMLEIFPEPSNIFIDDLRIYNTDVNMNVVVDEFRRSYRYFNLTNSECD